MDMFMHDFVPVAFHMYMIHLWCQVGFLAKIVYVFLIKDPPALRMGISKYISD